MTNAQIIDEYIMTMGIDFEYDGDNLLTFAQWKQKGMSVIKGEKAFIQLKLWTFKEEIVKDENGKPVMENGKPKKEKNFYLKTASLFRSDQVEKAKAKKAKKKTAKKVA